MDTTLHVYFFRIYIYKATWTQSLHFYLFLFLASWTSSSRLSLTHAQLKSLITHDMNRISYQDESQTNANVFTQNRAWGQQSVTDNWRQMCFSTARVMECIWGSDRVDVRGYQRLWVWGRLPPDRRFVSTVCQRVWDIVSLRERASRLATLNHTTISEEHGEKRGIDLVIHLGGTLHLWAQEFTDISRGWHCLTLTWS